MGLSCWSTLQAAGRPAARDVAAEEEGLSAGGQGFVQAPTIAHLGLQGGGQPAHLTGSQERPWPGRFGCGGGALHSWCEPWGWWPPGSLDEPGIAWHL